MKHCNGCDRDLPVSEFTINRRSRDGLKCYCKTCSNARNQTWREANPDKETARSLAYYAANAERERERNRRYKEATGYAAAYYAANREREHERKVAYRKADPERTRRLDAERNAKQRGATRAWREKHPERNRQNRRSYQIRNRDAISEANRAWRVANPEATRALNNRRRARERRLDWQDVTVDGVEAMLSIIGRQCVYCGGPYEHLDHYTPLALDGLHAIENLVPSCAPCNLQKHDRHPEEWLALISGGYV